MIARTPSLLAFLLAATPAVAQHSQVSAVAVDPTNPGLVWVANRDNDSVSLVDVPGGTVVTEIRVGVNPRSLALSADGSRLFVANQRGNVPLDVNFIAGGFNGSELRGSVSVVDTTTLAVQTVLSGVGVEPYGVAVSPNGKYFAVSGFRSGTIKLFDVATLAPRASFEYLANMNFVPAGSTIADVDSNLDGMADLGDPRGFTITSDSTQIVVTHNRSPFLSVLDVQLSPSGDPTGITLAAKIDLNEYPFDLFQNNTAVQTVQSQGLPRFLEDVALDPSGQLALVPHLLHNVNHDVNHDFGGAIAGDFANRVYPALSVVDLANQSFGQPGDASNRLHDELSDEHEPAEFSTFGDAKRMQASGNPIHLGGSGDPVIGGSLDLVVTGWRPGDTVIVNLGNFETFLPFGSAGTLLVKPRFTYPAVGGVLSVPIPPIPTLDGFIGRAQALVTDAVTGEQALSNGLRFRLRPQADIVPNKMGHRAGHPERVQFSPDGNHVLMLNRGSEDVFLYDRSGSDLELRSVFPPRLLFVERAALDETTPMGDLPLGMAMVEDATTDNDDVLLYVINEGTRTLSTLRVDFGAGTIHQEQDQIKTVLGADRFTDSERLGQELFEDASRAQTTGHFNNSCASCHFEGGGDGNVWQRPAGPRSTMPVYGGTMATGLMLWKGVRLNMGETGPMFGGENGGHGLLSDAEQQALVDYHEVVAVPLNPNWDPGTGTLTPLAMLGQDLFLGTNDTGLNPTLRHAGCASCHAKEETDPLNNPGPRFFTVDFLSPQLTGGETLGGLDPNCFSLRENIVAINIRNVNTAVNIDADGDGLPDLDRNLDGFSDVESYAPMNADTDDDFRRDDPNSYACPCDPQIDPNCSQTDPFRLFTRDATHFSIPTKLGVFGTGPYFHDHAAFSLRSIVDPSSQVDMSPGTVYGNGAYNDVNARPGLMKTFNEFHDVRGHEDFLVGVSKVQQNLQSANVQDDIEAILAYIQSL